MIKNILAIGGILLLLLGLFLFFRVRQASDAATGFDNDWQLGGAEGIGVCSDLLREANVHLASPSPPSSASPPSRPNSSPSSPPSSAPCSPSPGGTNNGKSAKRKKPPPLPNQHPLKNRPNPTTSPNKWRPAITGGNYGPLFI
jgi:hypothetical protein